MNKVTQQNAANAEESASASEELSAQAETMMQIVDKLVVLVDTSSAKRTTTTALTRKIGGKKKENLSPLDHAFHHIANSGGVKEKNIQINKAAASRMLPLDDSEFKSFNG